MDGLDRQRRRLTGYNVYRGTTKVGYHDHAVVHRLRPDRLDAVQLHGPAHDAAGNVSAASAAVKGTTSGSGGGTGPTCTATYSVTSDWGNGFNGNVTITNTGTTATKSWKVTWTWGGNQTITNTWNATETQSGKAVTATNAPYNNVIAPGASTSFGFNASYSGTNGAPTVTCTAT